jgi:tetratricopeptide (TPR) repeat protein
LARFLYFTTHLNKPPDMKKTIFAIISVISLCCVAPNAMAQNALLKEANEQFEQFAFPKAIELYLKLLEKDRDNAQALANLADCYRLTSDTRNAERYYKKAVKVNKDKHQLKLYYAQAMMSNKNYGEALAVFEDYTRLMPHDSRGWNFSDYCRNINEYMRDSSMYSINRLAVNSPQSDISPVFYGDGIVFASGRPKGLIDKKSEWTGESLYDIFYTKENAGTWASPEPLAGKPESQYDEGPVAFNSQNTVMYFTRNLGKSKAKNGTARLGIFQANKIDDKWTNIKEMPFNNEYYSVGHPAISPDGKTLYFTSDMPNGTGGKDIYMSKFKNGTWSKPENLGTSVNTEGDEMFPYIHADGTLYFASNGWGGFGGLDVFAAKPVEEDWLVINMGYPINSSRDDFGLILNIDKTLGYISSNRAPRSSDDVYKIAIQPTKARQMMAKKVMPIVQEMENVALANDQTLSFLPAVGKLTDNNTPESSPTLPANLAPANKTAITASQPEINLNTQAIAAPDKTNVAIKTYIASAVQQQSAAKMHSETPSIAQQTTHIAKEQSQNMPVEASSNVSIIVPKPQTPAPAPLDQTPFNAYKPRSTKKDPILSANDPQVILMGIVVNKINNQPLANAVVSLIDNDTKEETKIVTSENGNFIFKLNCQKNYVLSKLFGEKQEDSKKISTINKCNPEMLHAILTGTPSGAVYRGAPVIDPQPAVAEVKRSPKNYLEELEMEKEDNDADIKPIVPQASNMPNTKSVNADGLLFKIQIGSFSYFRSTAHRFFDGVRQEINSGKLKIENRNGLTRYIIGTYTNYEEAEQLRQSLLSKYPDAYVAGYVNGFRIEKPIEEILMQYK